MCMNCMSKESWPILYSKLQNRMGQDFLDIQYNCFYLGMIPLFDVTQESGGLELVPGTDIIVTLGNSEYVPQI